MRLSNVLAWFGGLAPGVAFAHRGSGTPQRPVYQPPQSYYLALGDSIAYGFQPNKAKRALHRRRSTPATSTSSPRVCGSSRRRSRSSTTAAPASPP